ncbi:hypothetical protein EXN24_01795 [Rhizobium rhizogenes]|jgi:hypothetical protein|uniref:Uncharacterized protein n=1 Tax=Rhizobium rhizogenes TaxID=359 RepID=A0AA94VE13_RHIRH|nr:hypothetical protein AGROH133_07710 [Agrobacterium tumefaciens]MDQ1223170.1 hypothetical protein [Agrobacterium sp. SORGH_AS_0745]TRA90307.1 hypothetical protein EXN24_01795 [Rhizobium rhizogenes]TWC83955.1 hypothetical protein FB593_103349 [Rhizobium sp. SJZ105]MDP9762283.1 hypothetical protein [Agrobacterium tumefaciens]
MMLSGLFTRGKWRLPQRRSRLFFKGRFAMPKAIASHVDFSILLARRLSSAYLKGINSRERNAP